MFGFSKNEILSPTSFSYCLVMSIQPGWGDIYEKLAAPSDQKKKEKWADEVNKKIEKLEKDKYLLHESLYGRRYVFTEYYDCVSGLVTRFQKTRFWDGEQQFSDVEEFGDRGYILHEDSPLSVGIKGDWEAKQKLSIEIGEDFIRNDIFDEHIGGPKVESDYEAENYLFTFPLSEMLYFLSALGRRFGGMETNVVIKWPDEIEKKFKEHGITFETSFDYEPTEFDIEKKDKEFYEKWGKPKVSLYDSERFNTTYLIGKNRTYFHMSLKIFRPGDMPRSLVKI